MTLDPMRDRAADRTAERVPGPRAARTRDACLAALAGNPDALAAWEGGSASFGRADDASDLDILVICADGAAEDVLESIECALFKITEELDVWRAGARIAGRQRFWHPRGAGVEHIVMTDVSAIEHDAQREIWMEFLLPERHGRSLELHDPDGVLAVARAEAVFDAAEHRARIMRELALIRTRVTMFGGVPAKELARDRIVDAVGFTASMLTEPLVSLINMQHRPLRFDFGTRYLHDEVPTAVVDRLIGILVPAGAEAIPAANAAARRWIDELLETIDVDTLPIEEHAAQMRAAFG